MFAFHPEDAELVERESRSPSV